MKNLVTKILCTLITVFILPMNLVFANEPALINLEAKGSISINHSYEGTALSDVKFTLYKVASLSEDGIESFERKYSKYAINQKNLRDSNNWAKLADTVIPYTFIYDMEEYRSGVTNSYGNLVFNNVDLGVYLVVVDDTTLNGKKIQTKSFIVSVPTKDPVTNELVYDIKVETKVFEEEEEKTSLKVEKKWDQYYDGDLPQSVTVDLYKDNVLESTVILSKQNSWKHTWTDLDPDSEWLVMERNIPSNYAVTYEHYGMEVIITNTEEDGSGVLPDEFVEEDYDSGTLPDEDGNYDDGTQPDEFEDDDYGSGTLPDGFEGYDDEDGSGILPDEFEGDDDGSGILPDEFEGDDDGSGILPDEFEGDDDGSGTLPDEFKEDEFEDNDNLNDSDEEDKLPQTGLLWWPVPILFVVGIVLVSLGVVKAKKND